MEPKRILITSALPYCNNIPHLGNIIGSTLSGDVYSRFKKLQGHNVLYICGTDCYGTTTEVKAQQEGISCESICEKFTTLHKQVYDWFNIDFSIWGQTNTIEQTEMTHKIFIELFNNGYIEERTILQMYCPNCNKFLADRYLKGTCYHDECINKNNITNGDQCDSCQKMIDVEKLINPFCYICKTTPYLKETDHLYLKLDTLEQKINDYVTSDKIKLNDKAKGITESWLNKGLTGRCITRDLNWGTPVPYDYHEKLHKFKGKVFYVWFDAPFGYYSIIKKGFSLDELESNKWLNEDVDWTLCMGKDNIAFHTVFFSGSILGSNIHLPKPNKLNTTEYLNYENQKFSKSNNIGIFGDQVANLSNTLGINEDYWRFYLLKIRPESHDSSFDWYEFLSCCNSDLVGNIGNYVNRCVTMTNKYLGGQTIYTVTNSSHILKYIDEYNDNFENFRFKKIILDCLNLSTYGNQFLEFGKPWILAKNLKENNVALNNTLGSANIICYVLGKLLLPICPRTAERIIKLFKFQVTYDNVTDIINNNNQIILDNTNYDLLFKPLHIDDILGSCGKLGIKTKIDTQQRE